MTSEFYENSEILFTGGSGVVGKAAIDKLLRSCNVKKIYVLLRGKKGVGPEDRLVELKNSRIFKVLKEKKPNELNKLVAIGADIAKDGLAISPEDREQLKHVQIFFHSAATTRFNEPLKSAIRLNVKSTLEALKLAEAMKELRIFVHISTFFSHPYLKYMEDKVYPSVFGWRTALKMLEDDEIDPMMDAITNKIIEGWPNTYVFTKHLAEQVVNEYRFKLPVVIYKPSIVISAFEEPEPGFTETMVGGMGLFVIWGTGLIQSIFLKDLKFYIDLTPLDMGTRTLLMFTALKAQLPREKFIEATPVGKFSSTSFSNKSLGYIFSHLNKAVRKYPLEKSLWIPNVTVTDSVFLYWFNVLFLQLLPSYVIDAILKLFRQKPFLMAVQRRLYVTRQAVLFFFQNQIDCDGVTDFDEMLKMGEGNEFSIQYLCDLKSNPKTLNRAFECVIHGCRKFILNEDDSSIEQCKRKLKAKQIFYNVLRILVVFVVLKAIVRRMGIYVHMNK